MVEYCIAHNPLLLQLLGHWFTFIYRKCEHLAVGSLGQGLTRSRGHPPFVVALPSPFVPLLYHTLRGLSRGFLHFLRADLRSVFLADAFSTALGWSVVTLPRHSLSPLDTLIVSQLGRFVKGFFQLFFRASSVGFEPLGPGPSLQPTHWCSP